MNYSIFTTKNLDNRFYYQISKKNQFYSMKQRNSNNHISQKI